MFLWGRLALLPPSCCIRSALPSSRRTSRDARSTPALCRTPVRSIPAPRRSRGLNQPKSTIFRRRPRLGLLSSSPFPGNRRLAAARRRRGLEAHNRRRRERTTGTEAHQRPASGTTTASSEPPPSGPIGSFGQTIPAKFSKRNDILDHLPTMAIPLPLSQEQRKQIYDAVMAEKSQPVVGADALELASELS